MQSGLGRFFAAKFRSGVLYAIFAHSGDASALQHALRLYRVAREAWAEVAGRAKGVYMSDVTYGPEANLRGHWLDRLPAIDDDIARMEKLPQPSSAVSGAYPTEQIRRAVDYALGKPTHPNPHWNHSAPREFRPGESLPLDFVLEQAEGGSPMVIRLHYRHVNQAEDYETQDMVQQGKRYRAVIPAGYTQSLYGLQYYFQLQTREAAWLLPEFDPNAPAQPYYFVPRAGSPAG
jgi:hypothetical protein